MKLVGNAFLIGVLFFNCTSDKNFNRKIFWDSYLEKININTILDNNVIVITTPNRCMSCLEEVIYLKNNLEYTGLFLIVKTNNLDLYDAYINQLPLEINTAIDSTDFLNKTVFTETYYLRVYKSDSKNQIHYSNESGYFGLTRFLNKVH